MRPIILIFCLSFFPYAYADQEWRTSRCGPNGAYITNGFDCSVVADDPVSWCYDIIQKPEQLYVWSVQVYGTSWVKCGYRDYLNRQGAIKGGRNYGDEECAPGKIYDSETLQCIDEKADQCKVGNPISLSSGNKVQTEVDASIYAFGRRFDIKRFYNSSKAKLSSNPLSEKKTWLFQFEDKIKYFPVYNMVVDPDTPKNVYIWEKPNGSRVSFYERADGNITTSLNDSYSDLVPIYEDSVLVEWQIIDLQSNETYTFQPDGYLKRFKYSDGSYLEFSYDSGYVSRSVDVTYNGSLLYRYNRIFPEPEVNFVTLPDGEAYSYFYDDNRNLIRVVNPDNSEKSYAYNNVTYPQLLTGITNERGIVSSSWQYNADGFAIVSENADGAGYVSIDYENFDNVDDPRVTYTNAFGLISTMRYGIFDGRRRPISLEKPSVQDTPATAIRSDYNQDGFLVSQTDANGTITQYSRDGFGRELSRTEALGSGVERVITTIWDAVSNLPARITEPERVTEIDYDSDGQVLSKTVTPRSSEPDAIAPIAVAGDDQLIKLDNDETSAPVTLDASASYDPDSIIASYSWVSEGEVLSAQANVTTDLPLGAHHVALTVTDEQGLSATDNVYIVVAPNSASGYSFNPAALTPGGASDTIVINFNDTPPQPMTTQQNTAQLSVEDGGNALRFSGNGWQFVPLNYSVTPNTIIEFDYQLDVNGEIMGIGWDTDMSVSAGTTFAFAGSQNWGIRDLATWQLGQVGSAQILVGQYFTGDFNRLVFVNDDDRYDRAVSRFSSVRIYESDAPPAEPYYLVSGADTWESITLALYGSESVASALQAALGADYSLSEGERIPLSVFPTQLTPILAEASVHYPQTHDNSQEVAYV